MTPGARIAAAAAILDAIGEGRSAERALTGWARASRFAGSGDRAAIRDLVFDVLRRRRSCAWVGGAETGRGLMIGLLRLDGIAPETVMTGAGHAPPPPGVEERGRDLATMPPPVAADMPDWLHARLFGQAPDHAGAAIEALRHRAPVFVRVNLGRGTRGAAIDALAGDGIVAVRHDRVKSCLQVTENARRISRSAAYLDGLLDLQDASSQDAVLRLPLTRGDRVLDLCAGGGGKALAMADRLGGPVHAYDIEPRRMADIPDRAARAGQRIVRLDSGALRRERPFDLVLVDAPCSGSGTWRRDPEGKWALTPDVLANLARVQAGLLHDAADRVAPGGTLAYATCSILAEENAATAARFAANHERWTETARHAWWPGPEGDGFFLATWRKDVAG